MIKVKHIDFINHCAEIPAANAKSRHTRHAPLTDECLRLMELRGVGGVGKEYYLAGRTWMPSLAPLTPNLATKEWNRLREKAASGKGDAAVFLTSVSICEEFFLHNEKNVYLCNSKSETMSYPLPA